MGGQHPAGHTAVVRQGACRVDSGRRVELQRCRGVVPLQQFPREEILKLREAARYESGHVYNGKA